MSFYNREKLYSDEDMEDENLEIKKIMTVMINPFVMENILRLHMR